MLATYKIKVVGMTGSKWKIPDENNPAAEPNLVDQAKVFYEMQIRPVVKTATGQTRGRGVATEALVIGTDELFDKFIEIPTPFFAEVDIQRFTTGSKEVESVVGFRPLEAHEFDKNKQPALAK